MKFTAYFKLPYLTQVCFIENTNIKEIYDKKL